MQPFLQARRCHCSPHACGRHELVAGKYAEILVLDHYLEVLRRKPGALPGATALAQAKAAGTFTAAHQQYWDAARRQHGDAAGTRALIEVLLAHRTLPSAALTAAMAAAVSSGVLDPQVIVIEARRRAGGQAAPVIAIGALARYDRPAPALDAYDQLLTGNGGCPPSAPRPPAGRDRRPGPRHPPGLPRRSPGRRAR